MKSESKIKRHIKNLLSAYDEIIILLENENIHDRDELEKELLIITTKIKTLRGVLI